MINDVEVTYDAGVARALAKREPDGTNEFWLGHGEDEFPCMSLLVNGDVWVIHYFPEEGHPGWISISDLENLDRSGRTTFCAAGQPTGLGNAYVVSSSCAVAAAKEFLRSREMPKSLEWDELWQ